MDGRECTDPLVLRGTIAVESAERQRGPIVNRRVIIRSDAPAPCWLAQRAMNVCAKEGIFKIEVGAAMPPQTR